MILLPLFFLVYILVWVGLVVGIGAISWRSSKSVMGTSVAVAIAFFVMYWPAFGDYFPTVNAHEEYCEKEAGFKIYVTPEQWAAENPGVLETLVPYGGNRVFDDMVLGNERLAIKFKMYVMNNTAVRKKIESLVDIKTKKTLAENVDFSTGYGYQQPQSWHSIKIWLESRSCYEVPQRQENLARNKDYFKKLNTKWGMD